MAAPFPAPQDNPQLAAEMRPALVKYFLRKTGNAVEAEDLTQDVLVRALTHARWKTEDEAKGYIFRIAINRWRDMKRRLRTRGGTAEWNEHAEAELGVENPPERVLAVREELLQVAQVIDSLNERTRTVLMLIKLEKMKAHTVADMLGISVSSVNKHLAQAMARLAALRQRMDRR